MSNYTTHKTLARLKLLVNDLSNRDDQLKKDFQLFEELFENFPVQVTMWSITKDKTVISQRGNGFICQKAKSLEDMFLCPNIKEISIEKHELALMGNKVDYFIEAKDKLYFAKLVPRKDDKGNITGVSGISWDVTSNSIMLECIKAICEMTSGKKGLYNEVNKFANKGLLASKLQILLDNHKK